MKTFLALLLAALTASSASADIVIYKAKLNYTRTGAGQIVRGNFTGYLVWDSNTDELALVKEYKARARFSFEFPTDWDLRTISGGAGNDNVILSISGQGRGTITAKGNKAVDTAVGPFLGQTWKLSKVMTVTGSDLYTDTGEDYLTEWKGTFTYYKADTETANTQSMDFATVLTKYRDIYTNTLHYTEE